MIRGEVPEEYPARYGTVGDARKRAAEQSADVSVAIKAQNPDVETAWQTIAWWEQTCDYWRAEAQKGYAFRDAVAARVEQSVPLAEAGEVGTGAGEGATGQDTGTAWVTRSTDCPEAPAQAHLPALTEVRLTDDERDDARLRVSYYLEVLDSFYGEDKPDDVLDYATGDPDSAALLLSDLRILAARVEQARATCRHAELPDTLWARLRAAEVEVEQARAGEAALREGSASVLAISSLIDASYSPDLDPEAHRWRRCGKVGEEYGEVTEALLGVVGENPRKGVTHDLSEVRKELLDVALAALGAVAHLDNNAGDPMAALAEHAAAIETRLRAALTAGDDQ